MEQNIWFNHTIHGWTSHQELRKFQNCDLARVHFKRICGGGSIQLHFSKKKPKNGHKTFFDNFWEKKKFAEKTRSLTKNNKENQMEEITKIGKIKSLWCIKNMLGGVKVTNTNKWRIIWLPILMMWCDYGAEYMIQSYDSWLDESPGIPQISKLWPG